jgi:hypothetical protein
MRLSRLVFFRLIAIIAGVSALTLTPLLFSTMFGLFVWAANPHQSRVFQISMLLYGGLIGVLAVAMWCGVMYLIYVSFPKDR